MNLPKLNSRRIATILFDEYHSASWTISAQRPQTAAEELSAREFVTLRNTDGEIDTELLKGKDVLVLLPPCASEIECTTSSNSPKLSAAEIKTVQDFVKNGGGLFVVSEYENQKYGNNLNDLLSEFGITIDAYSTATAQSMKRRPLFLPILAKTKTVC